MKHSFIQCSSHKIQVLPKLFIQNKYLFQKQYRTPICKKKYKILRIVTIRVVSTRLSFRRQQRCYQPSDYRHVLLSVCGVSEENPAAII
jgi:hypothetical protein